MNWSNERRNIIDGKEVKKTWEQKVQAGWSRRDQKMIDPGIEPGTFSDVIQLCERDVITTTPADL